MTKNATNIFTRLAALAVCLPLLTLAIGCGEDDVDPIEGFDASVLTSDYANKIVLATYAELDAKASVLLSAVLNLESDTTDANLTDAQDAWTATRIPWEQSEAFLFGPVDTLGIDPKLDSWPVNRVDLDAVLASNQALNKETVDSLEETLKGFHTIEYLLFGVGSQKKASDLTAREIEYLTAVTESLKGDTSALYAAWSPDGGNFLGEFVNAGVSSQVYVSQKAAVQEIANGMITIADEVANGKISDPYNEEDTTLVESQFSFNSIADFQNNIRGIQNAYLGKYQEAGMGLTVFVAGQDSALDTRLKGEIEAAIAAIGAIPPPFRDAITNARPDVQKAIDAVRTVQTTLESGVLPLIEAADIQ